MKRCWPALLLLFCCLPVSGGVAQAVPPAGPAFTFSLVTPPAGLFIPGDEVRLAFFPEQADQITADSFTLAVKLPQGLLLADNAWQYRQDTAYRTLPAPRNPPAYPVAITTRIAPAFTGRQLTVRGFFADFPTAQQTVTFSVAEMLSSQPDTCFFFQDTTGQAITTVMATRRRVTARLRGPIDLSPTEPLQISFKKCKAFILAPGKKRDRQKEQCSALHFKLVGTAGEDYPARYDSFPGKIQGPLAFTSNSRKGDTLIVSVKTAKGRPLAGAVLTKDGGEILDAVDDPPAYAFTEVLDTATFQRTLHLRARRLLGVLPLPKQFCLVDVERRPAALTFYRDNGPPIQQPSGDTTLLMRQVIADRPEMTRTKLLVAHRQAAHTTFYRLIETVDKTGVQPLRRDTLSRDSCAGLYAVKLGTRQVKKQIWVAADTLLYQAISAEANIVGLRNPLGQQRSSLEVKIPLHLNVGDPATKDSLLAVAYWVGFEQPALAAYAALAEEVPPEWTQPGISPPLAAYGLGHPIVLPGLTTSEAIFQEKRVSFDFVDGRGRRAFAKDNAYNPLILRDAKRPNFGVLSGQSLRQLYPTEYADPEAGKNVFRFYLAFANRHAINSYRLQLNVVAYYQVFARQDTWEISVPEP